MRKAKAPFNAILNMPETVIAEAQAMYDKAYSIDCAGAIDVTTQPGLVSHQNFAVGKNHGTSTSLMGQGLSPSTNVDTTRMTLQPSVGNNEHGPKLSTGPRSKPVLADIQRETPPPGDTVLVPRRTMHGLTSSPDTPQSRPMVHTQNIGDSPPLTQRTQPNSIPGGSWLEDRALSRQSACESENLYPVGSLVWAGGRGVPGATWDPWPGRVVDPDLFDRSEFGFVGSTHRIVQRFARDRTFIKTPLSHIKPYVPCPSNRSRPFRDPSGPVACILADMCSSLVPASYKGIVDEKELLKTYSMAHIYPGFKGRNNGENIDLDDAPAGEARINYPPTCTWPAGQSRARQVALKPISNLKRRSRKPVVVRRIMTRQNETSKEGEQMVATPLGEQAGIEEVENRPRNIPNGASTSETIVACGSQDNDPAASQEQLNLMTQAEKAECTATRDGSNQRIESHNQGHLQESANWLAYNRAANSQSPKLFYGLLGFEEVAQEIAAFVSVRYPEEEKVLLRKDLEASCVKFKVNGPALLAPDPSPGYLASLLLRDRYKRQGITEDGVLFATTLFVKLVRRKEEIVLPEH